MNINLNNYEHWLLLYVDNELSPEECMALEKFLSQYPYLQSELELLQQTRLAVPDIGMPQKNSLLKALPIEAENNKLLLLLDNALPEAEATQLQREIAASESLSKEWQILQNTKLSPDELVEFPHKELLYKKEPARVRPLVYFRWAAAAVVIGMGIYVGMRLQYNAEPAKNNVVLNTADDSTAPQTKTPGTLAASQDEAMDTNNANGTNADVAAPQKNVNTATLAVTIEQPKRNIHSEAQQADAVNNTTAPIVAVNNKGRLAVQNKLVQPVLPNKPMNEVPVKNEKESGNDLLALQPSPNMALQPERASAGSASPKPREIIDVNVTPTQNTYAQTASLNYDESNNSFLVMEEENINRTKSGIFFKKLKRNIERRVGLKAGKGIRIAGFDLAVKD